MFDQPLVDQMQTLPCAGKHVPLWSRGRFGQYVMDGKIGERRAHCRRREGRAGLWLPWLARSDDNVTYVE